MSGPLAEYEKAWKQLYPDDPCPWTLEGVARAAGYRKEKAKLMAWTIRVWLRAVDADAEHESLYHGLLAEAVEEAIHAALAKLPPEAIPVEVQVRCLSEPRANGRREPPFRAGHCRDGRHDYCGGEEQDRGDGTQKACQCHCHERRAEG